MEESDKKSDGNEANQENAEKPVEDEPPDNVWKDAWMLKPCDMYYSEYKVCTSFRGRFYQLFIEGECIDCTPWKTDYDNCIKWKEKNNEEAYEKLVESEKERRIARLKPHVANDVWTRRDKPPEDWNAPLPEWLQKRDAGTFLAAKSQEIKTSGDRERELLMPSYCTIL